MLEQQNVAGRNLPDRDWMPAENRRIRDSPWKRRACLIFEHKRNQPVAIRP
jgi:hypothetical protein